MNMFRAFAELDTLQESYDSFGDRQELIDKIKALGKRYYFDKYSNEQLFHIWKKESAKKAEQDALRDYYNSKTGKPTCASCSSRLTDGGYCPICDDGAEDLEESIFDNKPFAKSAWVPMSGQSVKSSTQNSTPKKYIVNIVSHNGRLRALATDGVHPAAWVAFPNSLRQSEGQKYEVDQLIWNGKNYRVTGNINLVKSVATTQNIDENINKENYKMNFQTILEELDKLYEELPAEDIAEKEIPEAAEASEVTEECSKTLTEDADEDIVIDEEPIVDDEVAAEEAQLVLECAKCGALVIKPDADIQVDDETGLVNLTDACQYCEETAGYKILGNFIATEAPEEAAGAEEEAVEESLEEGIFDKRVEKTIKASEVKPGDKLIATEPFGKKDQPEKVKKVGTRKDGSIDIEYNGGNMTISPDDAVTVLTKN